MGHEWQTAVTSYPPPLCQTCVGYISHSLLLLGFLCSGLGFLTMQRKLRIPFSTISQYLNPVIFQESGRWQLRKPCWILSFPCDGLRAFHSVAQTGGCISLFLPSLQADMLGQGLFQASSFLWLQGRKQWEQKNKYYFQ